MTQRAAAVEVRAAADNVPEALELLGLLTAGLQRGTVGAGSPYGRALVRSLRASMLGLALVEGTGPPS